MPACIFQGERDVLRTRQHRHLKSGGFQMTVAEVEGEGVQCVWLGEDGGLFRETLPEAVLELVPVIGPEDEDDDEDDEEADEDEDNEAEKHTAKSRDARR
jgi:uncharacterized protein YodC (DUF2158 family)